MKRNKDAKRLLPMTPAAWLAEIKLAIVDAQKTKPSGWLTGCRITNANLFPLLLLAALVCLTPGCGESAAPVVDSQPFEAAVARYLDQNNMGVALKDIKAGPTIDGDTATLTASLHHATMGGPAVTWTFRFEQDADGTWKAVSHQ